MKLLIASDIHGSAYWCGRLCEEIEKENPGMNNVSIGVCAAKEKAGI